MLIIMFFGALMLLDEKSAAAVPRGSPLDTCRPPYLDKV